MTPIRFVILHHYDIPTPHFDLMFQPDQPGLTDLTTWRCPVWPLIEPTNVERLKDHRAMYLDYEGPVASAGGSVKRVAAGTCLVFPYVHFQWTAKLLEPEPAQILFIERSPFDYWVATLKPAT